MPNIKKITHGSVLASVLLIIPLLIFSIINGNHYIILSLSVAIAFVNISTLIFIAYCRYRYVPQRQESDYRDIVDNSNNAIIRFNLEGKITFYNRYCEKLYGYSEKEVIGKNVFLLFHPHFNERQRSKPLNTAVWLKALRKNIEKNTYFEMWNLTKNKKRVFMGWTTNPLLDKQGKIKEFISIGSDKTEHKLMLDKFQENQRKFRDIFDSVNDGILIVSKQGELLEQNSAILTNFGITRSQIASTASLKKLFLKLMPNLEQIIKMVMLKGEIMFDHEFKNIKGEKMLIEIRADKIIYEGQEAVLAVGRNVVNLRMNQQSVFNAALEAEERERSRIAKELHDSVSPILSTIKLYIQSIKDADDEIIKSTILARTEESINDCIKSVTEISNNLSPHVLENFGLVDAVKTYSEKVNHAYGTKIAVNAKVLQRPNKGIETTLYRVTTELISNTVKYANASNVNITFIQNNEFIMLKYTDNGIGFNKDKVLKEKKGMGLFNITNRIKSINGSIDFLTTPGNGVIVNIHVPLK